MLSALCPTHPTSVRLRISRWGTPEERKRREGKMKKILIVLAFVALGITAGAAYTAQEKTTMVGGQAMFPSKDIVDNAVNSADHTTLVAAVKAAGLVDTLKGT